MITTSDLESLGWKHISTMKNGGSKLFQKGDYKIVSHADNFIYELKPVLIWNGYQKFVMKK